jgi:tRNA(Ile)-lysidine synthase TilS/MesJ
MSLEHWEQERAELQAVLDELDAGVIKLGHGQDDYIASVKRRLAYLDEKLRKRGSA